MKILLIVLSFAAVASGAMTIELASSAQSPQPVGAVIGLVPKVQVKPPGPFNYRYMVSMNGGPFHLVRDFSQDPAFIWAPSLYEHDAVVRVTIRDGKSAETATAEMPFRIVPRVTGSNVKLTPTAHPLIALLSAPSCEPGSEFRAAFRRLGDEKTTLTSANPCRAGISNNAYVAGMRADSEYQVRPELVTNGEVRAGAWMPFHTGMLDGRFPPISTTAAREVGSAGPESIVIRSLVDPWRNTATDLHGNILWYLPADSHAFLTRVLPEGRFLVHSDGANTTNETKRWQLVREVDLLGNIIRETNIGRLAEQLEARGIKSDCKTGSKQCVSGFHHEAIRLPNGHTLVLAGLERMFPAGTQGAEQEVDVLGDLILDLDEDFQLAWSWNSFDWMDLKRASLGAEKCKVGPGSDGCTPVFLAPEANGWLHSNSLFYNPISRDLLVSIPEQDWVVRIDYQDGKGTGKVVWRLGKDGDFKAKSEDPYPWFSYQHDVGLDPVSGLLILFDDGHRRKDKYPNANNRGQAWQLDEASKTATLVMNADLGVYSLAVGSAQQLSDGNYSWESGAIGLGPTGTAMLHSRMTETHADGKIVFSQQVEGGLTYRSFRVATMYSAPRR